MEAQTRAILHWLESNNFFSSAATLESESGVSLRHFGPNIKYIRDLAFTGDFDGLISLARKLFDSEELPRVVFRILEIQFLEKLDAAKTPEALKEVSDFLETIREKLAPAEFKRMVFTFSHPPQKFCFARHKIADLFLAKLSPAFPEEIGKFAPPPELTFQKSEIPAAPKKFLAKTTALTAIDFKENFNRNIREISRYTESSAVRAVAVSGENFILGNNRGSVFTRDANFAEIHRQPKRHEGSVFCLCAAGALWASGSNDQSIKISGASETEFLINAGTVRCIAFDRKFFAASSGESIIREFSEEGEACGSFSIGSHATCLHPLGADRLLIVNSMGTVQLWDARQGKAAAFRASTGKATCGAGGNGRIVLGTDSGLVECFDDRKLVTPLWTSQDAHSAEIRSVSINSETFCATSFDGHFSVGKISTGARDRISVGGKIINSAWAGKRLVVTTAEGICLLYE